MSTMPNNEYSDFILSLSSETKPFKPFAYHDKDGDYIEFLISDDDHYAERIDDLVTVYYSRESKQIIGSAIKSVGRFIKSLDNTMPGLAIEILDGPVKLEHLFLAGMWSAKEQDSVIRLTYKKLASMAEQADAEAELSCG